MSTAHNMASKNSQQGSVLLEALVAFLIFSMGILGVIGLQATAINNTLDARFRSDAAFLANQIIAQMWTDPIITASGYDVDTTYACVACSSTNGNANTRAWATQIQGSNVHLPFLPGVTDTANQPSIVITQLPSGVNQVTVTLTWVSPQNGSVVHNYATVTQMQYNL
ncbi:MAG: type IV pilus modification protein PilV [Gallionella sp.]|nr:type IV pilus modification protein PilV [Gallionella sp.]